LGDIDLLLTKDGSYTLFNSAIHESYHSQNGALQESLHIFIENGFNQINQSLKEINILEIGFGTGLNAIQTLIKALPHKVKVNYVGVEAYPLSIDLVNRLDYVLKENDNIKLQFEKIHSCPWNRQTLINECFSLLKIDSSFEDYLGLENHNINEKFDLVYFDAFSPEKQPELWTKQIFKSIYDRLNKNGLLVTYSSKGIVKQALREAGFEVKRKKGPIGKRHILAAIK
jgi:tRNA U34 5-methylaminomethyl-2-thiouridine-forming methyltransferase MnmC